MNFFAAAFSAMRVAAAVKLALGLPERPLPELEIHGRDVGAD
jgi:hypothetical protein